MLPGVRLRTRDDEAGLPLALWGPAAWPPPCRVSFFCLQSVGSAPVAATVFRPSCLPGVGGRCPRDGEAAQVCGYPTCRHAGVVPLGGGRRLCHRGPTASPPPAVSVRTRGWDRRRQGDRPATLDTTDCRCCGGAHAAGLAPSFPLLPPSPARGAPGVPRHTSDGGHLFPRQTCLLFLARRRRRGHGPWAASPPVAGTMQCALLFLVVEGVVAASTLTARGDRPPEAAPRPTALAGEGGGWRARRPTGVAAPSHAPSLPAFALPRSPSRHPPRPRLCIPLYASPPRRSSVTPPAHR